MTNVRTQYREAYAPRTISKALLRALVEALVDFKPGLPTRSRKIRAKAISAGGITYLYACSALFIAGVIPAMTRSFHFLSPPKKAPIIQETVAKSRNFPWTEATAVLSFLAGVLELARALVAFMW